MVKNTAYAWRQMVFFLSLIPKDKVSLFIGWAQEHLEQQQELFRNRFQPALEGLRSATEARSIENVNSADPIGHQFLGWSNSTHWLLADEQ